MKEQEVKKRHAIGSETNSLDSDMKTMKQWADESRQKEAFKSTNSKQSTVENKLTSKKQKTVENKENEKKSVKPVGHASTPKKEATKSTSQSKLTKPQPTPTKKPRSNQSPANHSKGTAKKPNYLLWVTIGVIAIPCLILLYIFLGSRENSSEPVVGSRFKNALDPKITEEDLKGLESSLVFDGAEAVEINLKSATLRININAKDDLKQDAIQKLMNDAYAKVTEKLPVDKYFTNKKDGDKVIKMYDLEISAYNYIPKKDEEKKGQIHLSKVKNSSADQPVDDILSTPKDKQSAEEILNPDTSNPPTNDNKQQTEGE
ncbi:hypothetical protein D5266_05615 [bacterium c-19]|nr:hypothetical protein [bacterium c-19]